MSWVTIIWSMIAAACFTLALMHGVVGLRRESAGHALFALSAASSGAFALCELWMMGAQTPEEFGTALRWAHLPALPLIIGLVWFVRIYLRAGRVWLAWAVCVTRTLSLVIDFACNPNLNYREITAIRHIRFLGEFISVAEGVPNPWMLVGQFSLLLLIIFVADASITVWRRGDRRQSLVCGSIVFFVLAGSVQTALVLWGILKTPLMAGLLYQGLVAVMGYEMSRDVLRAAHLSAELRESEERMTLTAAATGLAAWRWRVAPDSMWVSADGRTFLGIGSGEAVTLGRFLETVHSDDREGVRRAMARSMEGEGDYHGEYRMAVPNGSARWISAHGRVDFKDGQLPRQMLGICIDITERKRAESDAERHRGELAHLARVTTLSELSGSLAHELNQPLGAILSNAQAAQRLLAQSPPDLAEVRDILTDIVSEDNRASNVIQGLRALLKQGEIRWQPLGVNEVVDEILRLVRTDLIRRGVTTTSALGQGLPPIWGDRIQLQQVLLNLIFNACDAMAAEPLAERRLHLATIAWEGAIRISVSDRGVGLPVECGRIFDPFFTTKPHGLGLGLAISRTIANAHRGRLWAEANPDRGATFHLSLQLAEAQQL